MRVYVTNGVAFFSEQRLTPDNQLTLVCLILLKYNQTLGCPLSLALVNNSHLRHLSTCFSISCCGQRLKRRIRCSAGAYQHGDVPSNSGQVKGYLWENLMERFRQTWTQPWLTESFSVCPPSVNIKRTRKVTSDWQTF